MLVQARSPALHRERVKTTVILLVLSVGFALLYRNAGLMATRSAAHMFGYFMVMICIFGGVSATADCIAREKRDGTIGLLFLTPLRPLEIVLGKLVSTGLPLFYGLILGLPLFSLMVVAGATHWTDVLALFAIAVNSLFVSAAVGIYASAVSLERRKAHGRGIWIVLFFWWMIPAGAELVLRFIGPGWLEKLLRMMSLSSGFMNPAAMNTTVMPGLLNMICVHLIGWFFLGCAMFYLPRYWQEHPPRKRFDFKAWWTRVSYGNSEARARLRRKLLDRNPFWWLACRDRSRAWQAWASVLIAAAVLGLVVPGPGLANKLASILGTCSLMLIIFWAGASASFLLAEHEQGTMELLLCTPLTPRKIMRGQIRALVRQFGGPLLLLLGLAAVVTTLAVLAPVTTAARIGRVAIAVSCASLYLFTLFALHHVGMWSVMTVRDPKQHAVGSGLAQLFAVPFVIAVLVMLGVTLLNWYGLPIGEVRGAAFLMLWFVLQCASNAFWIIAARRGMNGKMREWAMKRYMPEPSKKSWLPALLRLAGRTEKAQT